MAAFRFELDGLVFDLEFVGHPIPDCLEEVGREGLVAAIDLHVGRHHDEAWFHRPDVEVMDVLHAGDGLDGCRNECRAHAGWSGLQ